jgi:hypothetical protein
MPRQYRRYRQLTSELPAIIPAKYDILNDKLKINHSSSKLRIDSADIKCYFQYVKLLNIAIL